MQTVTEKDRQNVKVQTVTEKDRQTECKTKGQQIPETTPVSVRRNEGDKQRPCRQELRKEITERDWFIFEFQHLVISMMSPQEETEMEKTTNRHTSRQTNKRFIQTDMQASDSSNIIYIIHYNTAVYRQNKKRN